MNRRNFLGMGAAALAGMALVPSLSSCAGGEKATVAKRDGDKPNSNFGGVHMGTITYSWRDQEGGLDNLIKYCKQANVSNLELMGNDLETALGVPASPMMKIMQGIMGRLTPEQRGSMRGFGGLMDFMSEDEKQQMNDYNEAYANFKKNMDWDKVEEVRKRFASENIDIHIVKTQPGENSSDEDCEYAFKLAKAMGAKGVTAELSLEAAKRCAPFAEKYDMFYCMHNHMQYSTPEWPNPDAVLAVSPNIMLNFDFGHYYGSTGKNPCDFIEKYHNRIFSMHTKDKTGPNAAKPNENQVWGQGETPLDDVLKLVQAKYPQIYCDAELEYQVVPWSNSIKEVGTCMNYARRVLELG